MNLKLKRDFEAIQLGFNFWMLTFSIFSVRLAKEIKQTSFLNHPFKKLADCRSVIIFVVFCHMKAIVLITEKIFASLLNKLLSFVFLCVVFNYFVSLSTIPVSITVSRAR